MKISVKTYLSYFLSSFVLLGCKQSSIDIQKPQEKYAFIQSSQAFDPFKWVWGNYFEKDEIEIYEKYVSSPDFVFEKTIVPKGIIVDSIWFCHDKEYHPDGWLTLFMGTKQQTLKIEGSFVNGWSINGKSKRDDIIFGHYNNDKYLDFRLYEISGTMGEINKVFLFNPTKKEFEESKALNLPSLRYDRKRNIYQTWSKGGPFNFRAEQFKLTTGKKKSLRAIDVQIIEVIGGKRLLRQYMTPRDTLVKLYKMEEIHGGKEVIFNRDKYCEEFRAFSLKYKLK